MAHMSENNLITYAPRLCVYVALLILSIYFLRVTQSYPEAAQRFPLVVLSMLTILLVLKILVILLDMLDIDLLQLERSNLLDSGTSAIEQEVEMDEDVERSLLDTNTAGGPENGKMSSARIIGWLVVFTGSFYILGIITAIPLLMLTFLYLESDLTVAYVVLITVGLTIIMYALFIEFLNIRVYEGLIILPFEDVIL